MHLNPHNKLRKQIWACVWCRIEQEWCFKLHVSQKLSISQNLQWQAGVHENSNVFRFFSFYVFSSFCFSVFGQFEGTIMYFRLAFWFPLFYIIIANRALWFFLSLKLVVSWIFLAHGFKDVIVGTLYDMAKALLF